MDVLIVDDNEINLEVLSGLVNSVPGHRAHAFADPVKSLGYCERCEPDLYVVDYLMPGIDGIEFVRRVRALPGRGEVPILMVTAAGDRSVRQRALEAGATDFLAKPVDAQEFLVRMRNMLQLRSAYNRLSRRAESLAAEVARSGARIPGT
jgi:CheY-like chemotaxis protein